MKDSILFLKEDHSFIEEITSTGYANKNWIILLDLKDIIYLSLITLENLFIIYLLYTMKEKYP